MIYEITVDCRIANKDYKKWDIVSHEEVWEYFPSVMSPIDASKKPVKAEAPKAKEPKVETPVNDEEPKEDEAEDEEAEEEIEVKPTKKSWKKK